MCVNHRSADIAVAQEFLNRADVIPVFKQWVAKECRSGCLRSVFLREKGLQVLIVESR